MASKEQAKSAAALAEARQALQQTEDKLKAMEADLNKKQEELDTWKSTTSIPKKPINDATCQTSSSSGGETSKMLEQQVRVVFLETGKFP